MSTISHYWWRGCCRLTSRGMDPEIMTYDRKGDRVLIFNGEIAQAFDARTSSTIGVWTAKTSTGWTKDDVDLFEINEAFAMVTMLAMREHNLDHAKVNIYGGACAQGHPVGSTGSRLIVTLINALQKTGGKRGVASLCIGGGEATAVAIELV